MAAPSGWTHVVLNYIGPNNGQGIRFYFDGVQVANDTRKRSTTTFAGDGRMILGKQGINVDARYASVDVDELLFFNETLSDQSIQDMN